MSMENFYIQFSGIYDSDIETRCKNFLFLIGGTTEGYQWMYGKIDELRFYNRALSENEIKELDEMGVK